jgi:chemotaxis methyl-accepting protein methylase
MRDVRFFLHSSQWRLGDPRVVSTPVLVAQPDWRARLAADLRLTFTSWNILDPWPGTPANLVRAMNILNPSYFTFDQQVQAFQNLFNAMQEGGLLAAGSNEGANSVVDGTLYRRKGANLVVLETSGKGCRCAAAADRLLSVTQAIDST